ncbi:hypothetical protein Galf_0976 [Gallionella capsiferriformans ES-2]|uniref:Uncharacterized protein n=2 Tax=Gallionella TaxID=96 RepID=D9SER0_GALCS|nr:hypothetical protein Galf_0976 [Gallionella capsiferriformans ES-2]
MDCSQSSLYLTSIVLMFHAQKMKNISLSLGSIVFVFSCASVFAGTCDINYTRTACPGKEAISFKKCDGKASCVKTGAADTAEACRVKAVAACANDRLDITKSKVITATFNGKSVTNKAGGADHCADYAERAVEFDKCGM